MGCAPSKRPKQSGTPPPAQENENSNTTETNERDHSVGPEAAASTQNGERSKSLLSISSSRGTREDSQEPAPNGPSSTSALKTQCSNGERRRTSHTSTEGPLGEKKSTRVSVPSTSSASIEKRHGMSDSATSYEGFDQSTETRAPHSMDEDELRRVASSPNKTRPHSNPLAMDADDVQERGDESRSNSSLSKHSGNSSPQSRESTQLFLPGSPIHIVPPEGTSNSKSPLKKTPKELRKRSVEVRTSGDFASASGTLRVSDRMDGGGTPLDGEGADPHRLNSTFGGHTVTEGGSSFITTGEPSLNGDFQSVHKTNSMWSLHTDDGKEDPFEMTERTGNSTIIENDNKLSGGPSLSVSDNQPKSRHRMVDFVAQNGDTPQAFPQWKRHSIAELTSSTIGERSARKFSRAASIVSRRQRRRTLTASFLATPGTAIEPYTKIGTPLNENKVQSLWLCHHMSTKDAEYTMRVVTIPEGASALKPEVLARGQLLMKLNHNGIQNIVEIYQPHLDSSMNESDFVIIEDRLGENIADVIGNTGDVPPLNCGEIVREIAKGLRYLHSNGIHHLHLTDKSVSFRTPSCLAKSGISSNNNSLSPTTSNNLHLSSSGATSVAIKDCATGAIYGRCSVDFFFENNLKDVGLFPPEVISEDDDIDPVKRDIWALGVIAYKLFVGEAPFGIGENCNKDDFFAAILSNDLQFPSEIDSHIKTFISSLLSRDPTDRPDLITILKHRVLKEIGAESFIFSSSTNDTESCSVSQEIGASRVIPPTLIGNNSTGGGGSNKSFVITPAHLSEREKTILDMTGFLPEGLLEMESTIAMDERIERKKSKKKLKLMSEAEAQHQNHGSEDGEHGMDQIIDDCIDHEDSELHLANLKMESVPPRVFESPFDCILLLDLYNNQITELPDSIRFLVSLTSLILGKNQLTSLPEAIGDLSELTFLDVNHNKLTDLPQTLMFADQLVTVAMDYNDVEEFPSVIADLPTIKTLYLAANPRLRKWPTDGMFDSHINIQIGVDNEPSLVAGASKFVQNPLITIMWNKVYPDPIVPGVYCGSLRSAQTPHVYEQLQIGYVLTAGRDLEVHVTDSMKHKTIIVDDVPGAVIDDTFEEAIAFIEAAQREESGCLVHCFAGMSRSATTVIAYLMKKRGMRLDEAYCTTKKGRPAIYPNAGFFNQLVEFDKKLYPDGRPLDMDCMERHIIP